MKTNILEKLFMLKFDSPGLAKKKKLIVLDSSSKFITVKICQIIDLVEQKNIYTCLSFDMLKRETMLVILQRTSDFLRKWPQCTRMNKSNDRLKMTKIGGLNGQVLCIFMYLDAHTQFLLSYPMT